MNAAEALGVEAINLWVGSEAKVRLLAFFRLNSGVIETAEGLARRLALPIEGVADGLLDHVKIGILKEKHLGGTPVYMLDRRNWAVLDETFALAIDRSGRGA